MNKDDIKKNGTLLSKDGYRLGPFLANMTKQELIEEILSTHDWDYLLEYDMVVKVSAYKREMEGGEEE